MSIRERIQQEKAAGAARKEREAAAAREQNLATLKEQFESLLSRRTALLQVKEDVPKVTEEMKGARAVHRTERENLRSLHAESLHDDIDEKLPKPYKLVRDERFQEEPEVQSYQQAQTSFRLSAETAKNIQAQLSELGIPDSATLTSYQLGNLIGEKEKELDGDIRAFVMEHPNIEHEELARIREELTEGKAERWTSGGKTNATYAFARKLEEDGTATLNDAVHAALTDLRQYVNLLYRELGTNKQVSDIDVDALVRTISRQMVQGDPLRDVDNRRLSRLLGDPSYKDNGSHDDYHRHAEEFEKRMFEIVVQSPEVRAAAERVVEDFRKYAEYKALPDLIFKAEMEEQPTLREKATAAEYKVQGLEEEEGGLQKKRKDEVRWIEDIRGFPAFRRELAAKYSTILLWRVSDPEVWEGESETSNEKYKEISASWKDKEADEKEVPRLKEEISSIEREKDGAFGRNIKSKKERKEAKELLITQLQDRMAKREAARSTIVKERDSCTTLLEELKPYKDLAIVGGFKSGTIQELLDAMTNAVEGATLKAREAELALEESSADLRLAKLNPAKEAATQSSEELTQLQAQIESWKQRLTQLEQELTKKGLLEA